MAFTHINFVAFLFKGDVEGGRKSILEGIKIREELGVQLYVAAGNCDLGREKLNNRLTRLYKKKIKNEFKTKKHAKKIISSRISYYCLDMLIVSSPDISYDKQAV